MDWIEFKKSFTQQQEDALWQYFIDHSRVQNNGYLCILFYCKDVDDFWRRLYARASGEFHRYEKEDKETAQFNKFNMSREVRKYRFIAHRNSSIAKAVDAGSNLKDKLLLWLYRYTRKALFESGRPWKDIHMR